jgi:hypothetical protein
MAENEDKKDSGSGPECNDSLCKVLAKKYEYKREFVSRYYAFTGREDKCPETDVLEKSGREGWLLCARSENDSGGNWILYFVRELSKYIEKGCETCFFYNTEDYSFLDGICDLTKTDNNFMRACDEIQAYSPYLEVSKIFRCNQWKLK